MQKYNADNSYTQILSENFHGNILKFQSKETEINEFLFKDAIEYQKLNLGITYILISKETENIVSYITISSGALRLPENRTDFVFKGKRLTSYPKDFPNQFPALLIGKLATDEQQEGKGGASLLVDLATALAIKIKNEVGCAFLVTHAKAKQEVFDWYKKKGFKTFIQDMAGRETVPMYFEL